MKKLFLLILLLLICVWPDYAEKGFPKELNGTMMPIELDKIDFHTPDSLKPVFISVVSRHGARFLSSSKKVSVIKTVLQQAKVKGYITTRGERFMALLDTIEAKTSGNWGALNKLGKIEAQTVGKRLCEAYPELFKNGNIMAFSSFVPRVVMTMYELCHAINTISDKTEITTSEGEKYDSLVRFFEVDPAFLNYINHGKWKEVYKKYIAETAPVKPAEALVGKTLLSREDLQKLSVDIYSVVQSLEACDIEGNPADWFSEKEYTSCWEIINMKHYLERTYTQLSPIPAEVSSPLLKAIISDIDAAFNKQTDKTSIMYFGHAETLLPLLSLMDIPGCRFVQKEFEPSQVASKWKDWSITPLGANLAVTCLESSSGRHYVMVFLNGVSISPIKGNRNNLIEWDVLKSNWERNMK